MTSVTLDTNIYVSALEFGGIGARLIGMARAGMIRIDVSDLILDELITCLGMIFTGRGTGSILPKNSLRAQEIASCRRNW